jgi:hypothetical protein
MDPSVLQKVITLRVNILTQQLTFIFLFYSEPKPSPGHTQSSDGGGSNVHQSKSSLDDPRPYLGHTSLLAPAIKSEPPEHQFNKIIPTSTPASTTGTGVYSSLPAPNHHHHQLNNHQIFGFPPPPAPVATGSAGDVSSYVMGHHSAHHHHHHHHHMTAAKLMATT